MGKNQALLVVAGGRAIPNVLSLLWIKPQVVRVLLSKEGWDYRQAFEDIAHSLPNCQITFIPEIDAYDFDLGLSACLKAIEPYPETEWEWIFDITSAPKVTGIAAYEVAKQKNFSCWHVDAQRDRHVSLVKPAAIDTDRFFHLTLDDYMKAQHRTWTISPGPTPDYREHINRWADVARELALSPDTIELLQPLRDKKRGDIVTLPPHFGQASPLQSAIKQGLLHVKEDSQGVITGEFLSDAAAKFMGTGDWLEFYVWYEAIHAGVADEKRCQWGCSTLDGSVEKEFDLALIHQAQLILAECKAEQNPYSARRGHLHKLQAKANVLGGSYVCKLFITNQRAVGDSYKAFCQQADQYKIVVITGEKLPDIGKILKQEAARPTYPRI